MVHEAASKYWSQELAEEVQIVKNLWATEAPDYAVYISGVHVVAFQRLQEVEDYLGKYFMKRGQRE